VGFVPEGLDFRPSSHSLYAIDIGPSTTQLYTIDTTTGAATAVGGGFPSVDPSAVAVTYDLTQSRTFGFDFNPTTLQPDTSMRIRLVGNSGLNLRLNSGSGLIAAIDTPLNPGTPRVDGIAYADNIASHAGTTSLYALDYATDSLYLQNPPNAGTLNLLGAIGVTVDANPNMGFDIFTDPTTLTNAAYAVLTRPDSPPNGPTGAYLLYRVNLASGQITGGVVVGSDNAPFDFTGGFAIEPADPVPEVSPLGATFVTLGGFAVFECVRRRRARKSPAASSAGLPQA